MRTVPTAFHFGPKLGDFSIRDLLDTIFRQHAHFALTSYTSLHFPCYTTQSLNAKPIIMTFLALDLAQRL